MSGRVRRRRRVRKLPAGAFIAGLALLLAAAIAAREILSIGASSVAEVVHVRQAPDNSTGTARPAYLVTYRHGGREGTIRLSYFPGSHLPVQDGDIALDETPGYDIAPAPGVETASVLN